MSEVNSEPVHVHCFVYTRPALMFGAHSGWTLPELLTRNLIHMHPYLQGYFCMCVDTQE